MPSRSPDPVNALAGAAFVVLGLLFAWGSLSLDLGTALRMGPGYAPLVLSVVLTLLGAVILLTAFRPPEGHAAEPVGPLAWRGMAAVLPAPILFGLAVRPLGFVPAVALATLIACFASPRMRVGPALLLTAAVTLFSTLVFSYALGLPFRRFGPWLGL